MVNLSQCIPQKLYDLVVTWCVEEFRTVATNLLGSFPMRQKPHLGFPVKVDQRLWVKVMTLLNTFSAQEHSQTATWMYDHVCPVLAKMGSHKQGIFWLRFLCCSWFPEMKDMTRTLFTQIVGLKTKFPRRLSASRLYENGLILSGCLCWSVLVLWMQTTQSSYGSTVQ